MPRTSAPGRGWLPETADEQRIREYELRLAQYKELFSEHTKQRLHAVEVTEPYSTRRPAQRAVRPVVVLTESSSALHPGLHSTHLIVKRACRRRGGQLA